MSTLATLLVKLVAETAEFVKDVGGAEGSLAEFGKKASRLGSDMLPVSSGAALISGSAIKMAADFETSMAVLQQTSGASAEEMAALSAKAVELGADMRLPGTSASDAATAMLELSKAGVSVNDVLAASRGVLQLSAAGQLSNAAAAEVTAAALNMFGLKGSEASRVADLLAASANASAADVSEMAAALQQGGSVAAAAGVPIEDMTTALALMANAGIKGSDAGTSMKTMLMRLMAPTSTAAATMEQLGIKVYDAQGKMLPLPAIIEQFSSKLGGMSQEQRNAALSTIFGTDAIRAANTVLMGGTAAWNSMEGAVTKTGAAQALAGAQMTGLNGAFGGLKSAIETTLLTAGQPFLQMLTNLVTGIGNIVSGIGQANPLVLQIGMALLAVLAVVAPLGLAIGMMSTAFSVLLSPIGLVILAIAAIIAIGALLYMHWGEISAWATQVWGQIAAFFTQLWQQITAGVTTAWTAISLFFSNLWLTISTAVMTAWTAVVTFLTGIWTSISTTATTIWNAVSAFFTNLWNAISQAVTVAWTVITAYLTAAWTIISALAAGVFNVIKGVIELAWNLIKAATEAVWGAIRPYLEAVWNAISGAATAIWSAVSGFFTAIWTAIQTATTAAWGVIQPFLEGVWNTISSVATTIWTAVSTFFSTTWTAISTAATTAWNAIKTFLTTLWTGIQTTATTVWNAVSTFFSSIWTAIQTAANTVWNGIKTFLTNLWTTLQTTATTVWNALKLAVTKPMEDLWKAIERIFNGIRDTLVGIWEDIKKRVSNIVETLIGAVKGMFAGFNIHIPLPHFEVSWNDIGFGVKVPKVNVNWYRMGGDFVANGPQLIGVGENGPEHVQITPWRKMGRDGGDGNGQAITINLNDPVVRETADLERLADLIGERLGVKANVNRRMNYGWAGS